MKTFLTKREQKKILHLVVGVSLTLILTYFGIDTHTLEQHSLTDSVEERTPENTPEGTYRVVRIVDGDTIVVEIDGTNTTVRYIGIDTPETKDPRRPVECFGQEASQRNAELVEHRNVTLVRDVSDTDKYGRLLRYVFVEENGTSTDVGLALVSEGFATSLRIYPDTSKNALYKTAEETARTNKRGLWGNQCAE